MPRERARAPPLPSWPPSSLSHSPGGVDAGCDRCRLGCSRPVRGDELAAASWWVVRHNMCPKWFYMPWATTSTHAAADANPNPNPNSNPNPNPNPNTLRLALTPWRADGIPKSNPNHRPEPRLWMCTGSCLATFQS